MSKIKGKVGLLYLFVFGILLTFFGCPITPTCPSCSDCAPQIVVTSCPAVGSFQNLEGITIGIDCAKNRLLVYIKVSGVWWVKPYLVNPLTEIASNEKWICDITTGGVDQEATAIRIYAVSSDYQADLNNQPQEGEYIAFKEIIRVEDSEPEPKPDLSFLTGIVNGSIKTINYSPLNFNPLQQKFPTRQQIAADLNQLYGEGYRSIVNYDVSDSLSFVPEEAKKAGFTIVGVGIWDIKSNEILEKAIGLKNLATYYVVGSEGILRGDYTVQQLKMAMEKIRKETGKAVTTSEPWAIFTEKAELITISDFVTANIYGWWEGIHSAQESVDALVSHYQTLKNFVGSKDASKIVVVRETGFPTGGHPEASVKKQQEYFQLLAETQIPFFYFEAYDQFWKNEMSDGYNIGNTWGLHDQLGNLKKPETDPEPGNPEINFTLVPPLGSFENLKGIVKGIDRNTYRIVVYIKVNGNWWVKPYAANALTTIQADNSWVCDITTGGVDQEATEIAAFVVQSDYQASVGTLPATGQYLISISATR